MGRVGALACGHPEAIATWPPAEAAPGLSSAQHHGLLTCLLDFTWDPYVPACFAVRGFMDSATRPSGLPVWIIDDPNFAMKHFDQLHTPELLVPATSGRQTLQSQEGLFMWQRLEVGGDIHSEYQELPSFERVLTQSGAP